MAFLQTPPELGNQFVDDPLLIEHLERKLGRDHIETFGPTYRELGEMAGGELYRASLEDRQNEPEHTPWDPWGRRIDRIDVSPLWRRAQSLSAKYGMVAAAYDDELGDKARTHQFALNYILQPSLDVYSCPLAMTDGAARTLLDSGNEALIDRAVPRLLSRDPDVMWTSGQWMTERTGGSDVGASETVAHENDGTWRLSGTKWFTSATTAEMALTLARPEGNGPGGRGLALFYVELRTSDGQMQNITVNRLKDKLGTRKVPTAELTLDGTPATLVGERANGVRNIAPMLNVTRTWNAVASAWSMRRAIALARDYSARRKAFGSALADKPLHVDTLASLECEKDAAFLLAFRSAELLGKVERGTASEAETQLFRLLTPIAKLVTAKQAVSVVSEAIEAFGGAGYVEDTGMPRLLADAQVLPIWEGTTNVLSLDALRVVAKKDPLAAFVADLKEHAISAKAQELASCADKAVSVAESAVKWLEDTPVDHAEAGARRFALTLGRAYQLALLSSHAQWAIDAGRPGRSSASARRFATHAIDQIRQLSWDDTIMLGR